MSRTSTLTIAYRGGTDATDRTKALQVDVTAIYNAGYNSGQTASTYPVDFDVVFSDGGSYSATKKVTVECVGIYNQGANDAPASNVRYIYATGNDGACNVRTAWNGGVFAQVKVNTKVTYLSEENGYVRITYRGFTGWVVSTLVHTTPKSGKDIVTGSWQDTPEGYINSLYIRNTQAFSSINGQCDNPGAPNSSSFNNTCYADSSRWGNVGANIVFRASASSGSAELASLANGTQLKCANHPDGYTYEWMRVKAIS